jgi:hypothetical protein
VTDATNPANPTGAFVPVIRGLFVTNGPLSGPPRQKTTWRFAGFAPGTETVAAVAAAGAARAVAVTAARTAAERTCMFG